MFSRRVRARRTSSSSRIASTARCGRSASAQRWRGVPVVGGQVSFTFERDRLFVASSAALPNVAPAANAASSSATLAVRHANAEAWIARAIGRGAHVTASAGRVVVPIVHARAPGAAAAAIEFHLAEQVTVDADGGAGSWDVFVDDRGAPLARHTRILDGAGTLVYNAAERYPLSTRIDYPAGDANITADGSGTQTAIDGTFS